jgi:hypothetical protein
MEFDLDLSYGVLERTPSVLRSMLAGLPDAWTRSNEGKETFSPFDVVGHLIDGEETDWIPRARIILAQGPSRRFEPFDGFRHFETNAGRSVEELLDRFAELRAANVATLRGLGIGPQELRLEGEHPALGRVTMEQLLATWVAHDLEHAAQISRVMAKQYARAVGPWREYLPLLTR